MWLEWIITAVYTGFAQNVVDGICVPRMWIARRSNMCHKSVKLTAVIHFEISVPA